MCPLSHLALLLTAVACRGRTTAAASYDDGAPGGREKPGPPSDVIYVMPDKCRRGNIFNTGLHKRASPKV